MRNERRNDIPAQSCAAARTKTCSYLYLHSEYIYVGLTRSPRRGDRPAPRTETPSGSAASRRTSRLKCQERRSWGTSQPSHGMLQALAAWRADGGHSHDAPRQLVKLDEIKRALTKQGEA